MMAAIRAAIARKEPLDHTLFHGPPGLGKTTLAVLLGESMSRAVYTVFVAAPFVMLMGPIVDGHPATFGERIRRVAPRASQVAGGEADEHARPTGVRRLALNRVEQLHHRQRADATRRRLDRSSRGCDVSHGATTTQFAGAVRSRVSQPTCA